jgi:hypothetical protein
LKRRISACLFAAISTLIFEVEFGDSEYREHTEDRVNGMPRKGKLPTFIFLACGLSC